MYILNLKNNLIFFLIFSTFFLWDIKTFFIFDNFIYRLLDFKNIFIILFLFSLKKIFLLNIRQFKFIFIFFILHEFFIFFYKNTINSHNVLSFVLFLIIFFLTINHKSEFLKYIKKSYIFFILFVSIFLFIQLFENISLGRSCNFFILKNKFLFYENSHFGMIFPALFIFFSYRFSKKFTYLNFFYLIICFICFVMFFSLTGAAGLIVSVIILFIFNYKYFNNKIIKTLFIFAILFCSSIIILKKSCSERISEVFIKNSENINTSSIVYKNAFSIAINSLFNYPVGLGINNYVIGFKKFNKGTTVFEKQLNFNDGRSVFFKMITEYGFFTLIFFYFFIFYLKSSKISIDEKILISPIVLTQLISGAGYFNGGFIICFFVILISSFEANIKFFFKK